MSTSALMQNASPTNRIILMGAILTLGNLAEILHKSSRIYLFQEAQCLVHYKNLDPSKIHPGFHIDEALCKVNPIQSRLATIDGIDSFLYFLPRKLFELPTKSPLESTCMSISPWPALTHSPEYSSPCSRSLPRAPIPRRTATTPHSQSVV